MLHIVMRVTIHPPARHTVLLVRRVIFPNDLKRLFHHHGDVNEGVVGKKPLQLVRRPLLLVELDDGLHIMLDRLLQVNQFASN